jgi:hypothetical protein
MSLRRTFFPTFAFVVIVCSTLHAQSSTPRETQGNQSQSPNTGVYTGREIFVPKTEEKETEPTADAQSSTPRETQGNQSPNTGIYTGREVFVPETEEKKEPEPMARTFADGFLRNTRHLGFSVRASNIYSPNLLKSSNGRQATSFVTLEPQLYLNLQKRKLNARLTYGATYRGYNKELADLNAFTQSGTASFGYTLFAGRKTTLNFSDSLSSVYYDATSLLETFLPTQYLNLTNINPQIYVDRRRETRNSATINLYYSLTRKASLNATVGHDLLRYGSAVPARGIVTTSIGASYQLTRWLHFDTHYTDYLNVARRQAGNDVQNLQFGGLSFDLGRGWVISTGGGIDSTKSSVKRWTGGSSDASISKSSGGTTIALGYHYGFSIFSVGSQVWRGHAASAHVVQKLFRQVRIHANASYFRGSTLLGSSMADTIYGGTGAEVALQKNFVVSTSFSLTSQRLVNVPAAGPSLYRYNAMVGVTYYLPSIRDQINR